MSISDAARVTRIQGPEEGAHGILSLDVLAQHKTVQACAIGNNNHDETTIHFVSR
jgi:hypothetical protein